jgi:cytochrome b
MERIILRREYVYDPVLRAIHAWNGVLIVTLLMSSQLATRLELAWPAAAIWRLHLWLGYGLVLGLSARLTWFLVGARHARWHALWQPQAWRAALRARRFVVAPSTMGHHPLASAVYLLVYALLLIMAVSGLALAAIDQGTGPLIGWLGYAVHAKAWFRLPHEWLQYVFMTYIVAHIGALIVHERLHGVPLAQAMISGYQYLKENRNVANPPPDPDADRFDAGVGGNTPPDS